jgi:uncharacterized protein with PQ loop repeat
MNMTITASALVGSSVLLVSILSKVLGVPDQIRRNWKRKSTAGISPLVYVLSLSSYALWTLHGIMQGDLYVVGAQSIGIFTSSSILFQMWMYRPSARGQLP